MPSTARLETSSGDSKQMAPYPLLLLSDRMARFMSQGAMRPMISAGSTLSTLRPEPSYGNLNSKLPANRDPLQSSLQMARFISDPITKSSMPSKPTPKAPPKVLGQWGGRTPNVLVV